MNGVEECMSPCLDVSMSLRNARNYRPLHALLWTVSEVPGLFVRVDARLCLEIAYHRRQQREPIPSTTARTNGQ